MDETNNVFDISDYGGYFDVSAESGKDIQEPVQDIPESENDTDVSETSDNPVNPSDEETLKQESPVAEVVETPGEYTEILQDINAHVTNIETISIGILLAVSLLLGLTISRIFLDKLWR